MYTRTAIGIAAIALCAITHAETGLERLGDGETDVTGALQHAINETRGLVEIPAGTYIITDTLVVDVAEYGYRGIRGANGATRIIMRGAGPALRIVGNHQGTADPGSIQDHTWEKERFPTISGLEIKGDHPEADGITLYRTLQCTIQNVLIRNCRYGVHLIERNRNFLLADSHIYDGGDTGVFLDNCNLHQANIIGNHISYNKRAGIRQINGDVHNIQITGNDIEYNAGSEESSGEIVLEATTIPDGPTSFISEYTIASNTIQARPEHNGANIRIIGEVAHSPHAARNITITSNVLGSRQKTIEFDHVSRATISGNSIYGGREMNLHLKNTRNIVVNGNTIGTRPSMHDVHERYADGILVEDSTNILLNGNTLAEARLGTEESGGAITFRNVTSGRITACQIINPKFRGIVLEGGIGCVISDNTITSSDDSEIMRAVTVTNGKENLVQNNLIRTSLDEPISMATSSGVSQGNTVFVSSK